MKIVDLASVSQARPSQVISRNFSLIPFVARLVEALVRCLSKIVELKAKLKAIACGIHQLNLI